MNRLQAIQALIANVGEQDLIVHANGAISRESFYCKDRSANFYLLGSMGLAASVGLGIAVSCPDRKVIILDGDGNLLMGLGNLAQIGAAKVQNLAHVVLDNGVYGTTGNQPTIAGKVDFSAVARSCGYRQAGTFSTAGEIDNALTMFRQKGGPSLIHIPVSKDVPVSTPRIPYSASEIKERFLAHLTPISSKEINQ